MSKKSHLGGFPIQFSEENKFGEQFETFKKYGRTDNSRISFSNHQSETTDKEEEREEDAREGGTKRGKSGHGLRNKAGDIKRLRISREIVSDTPVTDEELCRLMPRGFKMMTKMGYQSGESLGALHGEYQGYPLSQSKHEREGLRVDETIKFQKFVSNDQAIEKKYRIWESMQRIAFELTNDVEIFKIGQDPRDFNVLWRSYIKQLNGFIVRKPMITEPKPERTGENSTDHELYINQTLQEETADVQEITVSEENASIPDIESVSSSYDGEDEELDSLLEMNVDERIMKLNIFLRSELYYCYYCGRKYEKEAQLFGECPGISEEDHE